MKIKKTKIISTILCCVIMCMCFSGCGAKSGSSKKITVNTINSTMKLTKVTYYDFYNWQSVPSYTGNCTVLSNTFNSTEVWFVDASGYTRVACLDKALSGTPSSVKVYTNSSKTTYDTYKCSY